MVISRFEEIESWQRARDLTAEIYRVSRSGSFGKDFGLRDQIQRSSISTMANIAEGFGRNGKKEFIRYLTVAQASSVELQSHLYIALDLGYITEQDFARLYSMADNLRKLVGGFIRYLNSCPDHLQRETRNEKRETSPHTSRSGQLPR
ncbi:MAG: four helix bundle protein [Acidobacteriia bacterium]|nr:four helix bundle protein [Terriglobia bacterium]